MTDEPAVPLAKLVRVARPDDRCGNCSFWIAHKVSGDAPIDPGECHVGPPVPVIAGGEMRVGKMGPEPVNVIEWMFPVCRRGAWCGQHLRTPSSLKDH